MYLVLKLEEVRATLTMSVFRVLFSEAFRGPASVFAELPCKEPDVAAFTVQMPVKHSRTV